MTLSIRNQLGELLDQCEDDAALAASIHTLAPNLPLSWAARANALAQGAEPRAALSRLMLLPDQAWKAPWPPPLDPLFHQGAYGVRLLGIALRHHPDAHTLLETLGQSPLRFYSQAELEQEMNAMLAAGQNLDQVLGLIRTREYIRIIRGEYELERLETICGALSRLAAACVQIALCHTAPELADQVVVFGMGKLGGNELNFLSDIDLIFFHRDDAIDQRDEGKAHRSRNRLFMQLRKVLRALEGKSPFRPLFRLDLRLRPFGSRGPLSMSLRAAESYYERYGRDWERQAWLRAEPIAGNLELGHQLLKRLSPFVYRRSISMAIFHEVQEVMQRARAQAGSEHIGQAPAFNLKLDRGGIREIEFFVQALQLLHAGKNPALKTPSTLRGLDRLASHGLISDREHELLGTTYRYFRQLEHRVQIDDGQQSHDWPQCPEQREVLLRRVHQLSWQAPMALTQESLKLENYRRNVAEVTSTLGTDQEDPGPLAPEQLHEGAMKQACDVGARPTVRAQALAQMGLRAPDDAAALIEHLCTRSSSAFSEPGPGRAGAIALLRACLESADPHAALQRLSLFSGRCPAHYAIWRVFAHPGNQEFVRQIADLFGVSEPLSQGLINSRGHGSADGVIRLLHDARATALPGPRSMVQRMSQRERSLCDPNDIEAVVEALLHFKHAELLRIGLFDLSHRPGPGPVGQSLSNLADLIVRTLLRNLVSLSQQDSNSAAPAPISLAVLALGKYGMQAMDYGSDLDLMFVYNSPSEDPEIAVWASKLVTRLTTRLQSLHQSGRLYEVDTRLRPSGRSGMLITSLPAFRRYHAKILPVWERIAMLRARGVAEIVVDPKCPSAQPAGLPDALCRIAMHEVLIPSCANGPSSLAELFAELHPLKRRIEQETTREDAQHWDLKSGQGGCMDFEFLVSAIQISQGRVGTEAQDFMDMARSFESSLMPVGLCRAYQFQRQLLNRLRLSVGAGKSGEQDRLHLESPRLAALGRRMGMPDAKSLIRRLGDARSQIRAGFLDGAKPGAGLSFEQEPNEAAAAFGQKVSL